MLTKKFFIYTGLSISTILLLSACGGNGGNSDNNMSTQTDRTPSSSDNNTNPQNKIPTIAIAGDTNITIELGSTYIDAGALATDEEDGNLTLSTISDVNTSKVGNYEVVYTAKDSKGQSIVQTRSITVKYDQSKLPLDTNTRFDKQNKYIYFANPQQSEGGHNSVVRIDYENMKLDGEIYTSGINPHSIDRAGDTDKFYVRTQNSNSFEIINFKTGKHVSKEIAFNGFDLRGTNPRSIGSYNAKHKLQLLAGKHRPIIAIIDTTSDEIVGIAGDTKVFSTTLSFSGHGIWFDDTYFGIVDRTQQKDGKYIIRMYKITDEGNRNFKIVEANSAMTFSTKLHVIERVLDPQNSEDLKTFYALGESDFAQIKKKVPSVTEVKFDSKTGKITRSANSTFLTSSNTVIDGIAPATHHGAITPDHKYYVAPVSDGNIYFLDRKTMKIAKRVDTNLDSRHKGLGAAHVEFSESRKVAIITNHFSNYLTILDTSSNDVSKYKIKAQIKIGVTSFNPQEKHLMQPHFAKVSDDGKYFYTAASHDGTFVRVDLDKIESLDPADYSNYDKLRKSLDVLKVIQIGGVIEQSHS